MANYIIRVSANTDIVPGRPLQDAVLYPEGAVPFDLPDQSNGEYLYGPVVINDAPVQVAGNPAPTRIEIELVNHTIPHDYELPVHIANIYANGEEPECRVMDAYQQTYASVKKVNGIWGVYLKKVMPSEPFEVTVGASNEHGGVNDTFTFEILPEPEEERDPEPITILEQPTIMGMGHIGDRLVANIGNATGWPQPTVQYIWTVNDTPAGFTQSLDTHELSEGDEIKLVIIRTNELGTVESETSVLTLMPAIVPEPELVAEYLFNSPTPPDFTSIQREDRLYSNVVAPAYLDSTGVRRLVENPNTHRIDYEGEVAGLLVEPTYRHFAGVSTNKFNAAGGATEAQHQSAMNLNGTPRFDYTFPEVYEPYSASGSPRVFVNRDWPAGTTAPEGGVEYISHIIKTPKREDVVILRFAAQTEGSNTFPTANSDRAWVDVDLKTGQIIQSGGAWFIRAYVDSATEGLWKIHMDTKKVTAEGANYSRYDRTVFAPILGDNPNITMSFQEYQCFVFTTAEEQQRRRKPSVLLGNNNLYNTPEVLRLSENLGTVDLEIDTTEGTINLPNQAMRGNWTWEPEVTTKITAIRAYSRGDMLLAPDPTDIPAYVAQVKSMPEADHHMTHEAMVADHGRLLSLVPRDEATTVAVKSADWFEPTTWDTGVVPSDGDYVLIPHDRYVTYSGQSDAELDRLRIDGQLVFSTEVDTRICVETAVIGPSGRLEIGTKSKPVPAHVKVEFLTVDHTDIDIVRDPDLMGRGLLGHGAVDIHGAKKSSFHKVSRHPLAGDTSITLAEAPVGWQVGDTLALTGTRLIGWQYQYGAIHDYRHLGNEHEVVTLTAVNGNTIEFTPALKYDHTTPRDDLFAYVANRTRNILFTGLGGKDTPSWRRGHIMFMHSDAIDVRYMEFQALGRTRKGRIDPTLPNSPRDRAKDAWVWRREGDTVTPESNIRGRYGLHIHRCGLHNRSKPVQIIGCSGAHTPGWLFAHHGSNADFVDCVGYDYHGSAFVAEDGDEIGIWDHNIAIHSLGADGGENGIKGFGDPWNNDIASDGSGFFLASRAVHVQNSVCSDSNNSFTWMHRATQAEAYVHLVETPEAYYGQERTNPNVVPIEGFLNNEAFACEFGLVVVKANPIQINDLRSVFRGFLAWEVSMGIDISYTSHYTFLDFDVLASVRDLTHARPAAGIKMGTNTFDMVFHRGKVDGFVKGIRFFPGSGAYTHHYAHLQDRDPGHVVIDVDFVNIKEEVYSDYIPAWHKIMTGDELVPGRLSAVFDQTDYTFGTALSRAGVIMDSIGEKHRPQIQDDAFISPTDMNRLIARDGIWTKPGGGYVYRFKDWISDRATGDRIGVWRELNLTITPTQIQQYRIRINGPLENATN